MLYDYPFFGLPIYSKMNRPIYYQNWQQSNPQNVFNTNTNNANSIKHSINKTKEFDKKNKKDNNYPFFTILNSQLYFDDLLIIFIILFLFSEGTNDYYLIFTLILLLLN